MLRGKFLKYIFLSTSLLILKTNLHTIKFGYIVNRDKLKSEAKTSKKIEDLEKKAHVSLTKDTTRLTNSNETIKVDKKVSCLFTKMSYVMNFNERQFQFPDLVLLLNLVISVVISLRQCTDMTEVKYENTQA